MLSILRIRTLLFLLCRDTHTACPTLQRPLYPRIEHPYATRAREALYEISRHGRIRDLSNLLTRRFGLRQAERETQGKATAAWWLFLAAVTTRDLHVSLQLWGESLTVSW